MGRPKIIPDTINEVVEAIVSTGVKMDSSSSQASALLKEHKGDHYNFDERITWKISSGSLLLDMALGGYITPSLIRLCGHNNSGKTPQVLEICRNFLSTVKNSKCVWFMAEGRLSKENQDRCGLKFTLDPEKWLNGDILVMETNTYEFIIKFIKEMVHENPDQTRFCFVIDSIDGLIMRDDLEKKIEDAAKVAGPALLSKKMMQSLSLGMFKFGHLMLLTSQVTSEIKLNQYEKTANRGGTFSGGNSLLHASDFILEYSPCYPSDYIMDNNSGKLNDGKSKPLGRWTKVTFQKSVIEATSKQVVKYPIRFGRRPSGVWMEYEIVDFLKAFNFIIKSGSWFLVKEELIKELADKGLKMEEKIQGEDNIRIFLEENPATTEYLFNKFKETLLSKE